MRIGDKVEHIDENLKGVITKIEGDKITFISEEGFTYIFPKNKLVVITNLLEDKLKDEIAVCKEENSFKQKKINKKIPEFDLHIEKILHKNKHIDKKMLLEIQLREAEGILNKMKRSHHREIIFIHGHGKSILKNALIKLIKNRNLEFFDASFKKYGGGAITVIVK